MNTKREIALVTGGGSGLGYEFAKLLVRDGYEVILVGRDEKRLQVATAELRGSGRATIRIYPADLATSDGVQKLWHQLEKDQISVDILINNAGVGMTGQFAELDGKNQLGMLQLNVTSLTELTRLVLPGMLERKKGKILNIASTAAFQPGPFMAIYYASKAYVLSFSEALWEETRGTGVTVTALCPGPTATGFQARAALGESLLFQGSMMAAEKVVEIGYQAMLTGRRTVVAGFRPWLGSWIVRFIPRWLVLRGIRRLHQT